MEYSAQTIEEKNVKRDSSGNVAEYSVKVYGMGNSTYSETFKIIPLNMDNMPSNIKQLSVAPLLAQAIARIHDDESVSSLFGFEKEMQVN